VACACPTGTASSAAGRVLGKGRSEGELRSGVVDFGFCFSRGARVAGRMSMDTPNPSGPPQRARKPTTSMRRAVGTPRALAHARAAFAHERVVENGVIRYASWRHAHPTSRLPRRPGIRARRMRKLAGPALHATSRTGRGDHARRGSVALEARIRLRRDRARAERRAGSRCADHHDRAAALRA
jgi:hypothetical protein